MDIYKGLKRRILTKYARNLFVEQVVLDLGVSNVKKTPMEKLNSLFINVLTHLIVSKSDLEMIKNSAWDEAEQYPGYIPWIDIAINNVMNPETDF